jgi:hypothetical protein
MLHPKHTTTKEKNGGSGSAPEKRFDKSLP